MTNKIKNISDDEIPTAIRTNFRTDASESSTIVRGSNTDLVNVPRTTLHSNKESDDETLNDDLSSLAQLVAQALTADSNQDPTVDDDETFIRDIAPQIFLSPEIEEKLMTYPELPPEDACDFLCDRVLDAGQDQVTIRSEGDLRSSGIIEVACHGREMETEQGIDCLQQDGSVILVLCGSAGMGKSCLANHLALQLASAVEHPTAPRPANIHFFDCDGLSSAHELAAIIATRYRLPVREFPFGSEVDLSTLAIHVASAGGRQPVLWIFDGLDDYLGGQAEWANELGGFFEHCGREIANFKVILTARKETGWDCLARRFSDNFGIVQVLAPPGPPRRRSPFDPSAPAVLVEYFGDHPLALRMASSALQQTGGQGALQLPLFRDDRSTTLIEAGQYAWHTLDTPVRGILALLLDLPGGVWTSEVPDEDFGWERLFQDPAWREHLVTLTKLDWLTVKADRSSRSGACQLYSLRPALRGFIASKLREQGPELRASLCRRLVNFWASRLKSWSYIIGERSTDRIQPLLLGDPRSQRELLAEERVLYWYDVTRLNWLRAFSYISEQSEARPTHVLPLYGLYLRCSINYFRMTGRINTLAKLVDVGLAVLVPPPAQREWHTAQYHSTLASLCWIKGRVHRWLGDCDEAERWLRKVEQMLRNAPNKYIRIRRDLAWTLTELGRVYHSTGKWVAAEDACIEALEIREALLSEALTPVDALTAASYRAAISRREEQEMRYLASTLNVYGNVLNERFRWKDAEQIHRRSLDLRMRLADRQPFSFQRYIATCLNDLGNSLFYQHRYREALTCYHRSLAIRERLVPNPAGVLGQYVARTCNNIGNTLRKLGRWGEAKAFLQRAVSIYRASVRELPPRFHGLLGRTLCNLARIQYHQRLLPEALKSIEEADRYHALAYNRAINPCKWVEACNVLAMIYAEHRNFQSAFLALAKADALLEEVYTVCPTNYAWHHSYTLNTRARVLLVRAEGSDRLTAITFLRESEAIRLELRNRLSMADAVSIALAQNWHDLGVALREEKGALPEARDYLLRALATRREIAQRDYGYVSRLIGRTALELGELYEMEGATEKAFSLYEEANATFFHTGADFAGAFRVETHKVDKALNRLKQSHPELATRAD